jgi:hypothetical protein
LAPPGHLSGACGAGFFFSFFFHSHVTLIFAAKIRQILARATFEKERKRKRKYAPQARMGLC